MKKTGDIKVCVSCSWCHEPNPADQKYCSNCGHRADLPRVKCDCLMCSRITALCGAATAEASAGTMTLEKAIDLLSDSAYRGVIAFNQDWKDALAMGIDALIAVKMAKGD